MQYLLISAKMRKRATSFVRMAYQQPKMLNLVNLLEMDSPLRQYPEISQIGAVLIAKMSMFLSAFQEIPS